jgi:hypothetical protein
MNACPACSQAVSPNDLVCPKCGISLHHGTTSAGPASGGNRGPSTALLVGAGVVGILLLFGCLIFLGASVFMLRARTPPVAAPFPAGSTIDFEMEEVEVSPAETSAETPGRPENPNP